LVRNSHALAGDALKGYSSSPECTTGVTLADERNFNLAIGKQSGSGLARSAACSRASSRPPASDPAGPREGLRAQPTAGLRALRAEGQ